MFVIIRVLVIGAIIWGAIKLVLFLLRKGHEHLACPSCDGKGYWWSARDKEFCKVCDGTGKRQR
ncbi:MAG: hypothetical protein AAGG68_13645 [Bacteroidota bacterium]